ncbi:MAG: hypothetical protein KatS3mg002_1450 [Candidatus Woesearchaeota archaeon]|nr:MAG: hypothetical protein KatS3mg002_1450 [Candidatus Woesearchaeota archaeon]
MRGQISTEYLIILGIAIAAILPAGYFFYQYSSSTNDKAIRSQVETIGNEIIVNAESVYGLAEGSLVSLDIKVPDRIKDIYILNRNELVIKYELSSGITESVFFSNVPLSGNFSYPARNYIVPPGIDTTFSMKNFTQGKMTLRFESKTSYVFITKQ